MSSPKHIEQQKRKHGEMADKVIRGLEGYGELTPKSKKLRDGLLKVAKWPRDSVDADENLGSVLECFEATQKRAKDAEVTKEELEAVKKQLEATKKQLEVATNRADDVAKEAEKKRETAAEEHEVTAKALRDLENTLEFGDWLSKVLIWAGKVETIVGDRHRAARLKEIVAARGGSSESTKPERDQAKAETAFRAFGGRLTTETHEIVEIEIEAVQKWRDNGEEEESAPDTPFLDRISEIADEAGVKRATILRFTKAHSVRNQTCHRNPPLIIDFRKVAELDKKCPEEGFDWGRMKASVDKRKDDVEKRYEEGKLDKERRDLYVELIETYWGMFSRGSDKDGNPILTQSAKNRAHELAKGEKSFPPPSSRDIKEYKTGKWDDIPRRAD